MKWSTKENNDKLKVQLEPLRSYTEHFDSGMIHMALPNGYTGSCINTSNR